MVQPLQTPPWLQHGQDLSPKINSAPGKALMTLVWMILTPVQKLEWPKNGLDQDNPNVIIADNNHLLQLHSSRSLKWVFIPCLHPLHRFP